MHNRNHTTIGIVKFFSFFLLMLAITTTAIAGDASSNGSETATKPSLVTKLPFKTESHSLGEQATSTLAVMLTLLGLGAAGLYALKRYFPQLALKPQNAKRLEILEVMRLNQKTSLFLVRMDQQVLLLGQTGDNLVALQMDANNISNNKDNQSRESNANIE
jgi:flagellar biogenesis protein FliO